MARIRIPGTLTQSNNLGKTTYRAAIEIYALRDLLIHAGKPIKIQHLGPKPPGVGTTTKIASGPATRFQLFKEILVADGRARL